MSDGRTVIYRYDGSYGGFLSCVFESFEKKQLPAAVIREGADAPSLFDERFIETASGRARRVEAALPRMLGPAGARFFRLAWLSDEPGGELLLIRYLRMARRLGPGAVAMTGDPVAGEVYRRARAVNNERMHYRGFLRFSDTNGVLTSVIQPKHRILSLLGGHFSDRYPEERWIIFDAVHREAMIYQPYERHILAVDAFEPPAPSEEERAFRALWRRYYHTIAIAERENPRCRMGHMPRRFWGELTEMTEQPDERLPPGGALSPLPAVEAAEGTEGNPFSEE